jgi:acetolactate synthase-1/2/3 large subunit
MAFALPGAIAIKLACPERKVLAAVGDGGFLMLGSELATAVREHVPVVVLIWEDQSYGLIKWKMELELGHHALEDDAVSVITCPVDYSQNIELTNKLGLVSEAL